MILLVPSVLSSNLQENVGVLLLFISDLLEQKGEDKYIKVIILVKLVMGRIGLCTEVQP